MDRHLKGGSGEGLGHVASVTSVRGSCHGCVLLQRGQGGCVGVSSNGHVARTIKTGGCSSRDPLDVVSHGVHRSDWTTLRERAGLILNTFVSLMFLDLKKNHCCY